MLNFAVQYKETSGIQRTFIVVFTDKSNASRFCDYINEHGEVPPVDDKFYYKSMVREVQINPAKPPKHHHSSPLEYLNSTAFEVSDSDCYGDAEQLVNDYSTHSYELETDKGNVDISAVNRAQARKFAEDKGYEVYSVNFTG